MDYIIKLNTYLVRNCNGVNTGKFFFINRYNYTENKAIIENLCNRTDYCINDNNSSRYIICTKLNISEYGSESCVMYVILTILINIFIFIIYKACLENYIDHFFIYVRNRIYFYYYGVEKPSYRYSAYQAL